MRRHQWCSVARLSVESGISAFRTKDGLWNQVDVEKYATPQGFQDNPRAVRDWYWSAEWLCRTRNQTKVTSPWPEHPGGTPPRTSTTCWNVPDATTFCICMGRCSVSAAITTVGTKQRSTWRRDDRRRCAPNAMPQRVPMWSGSMNRCMNRSSNKQNNGRCRAICSWWSELGPK